MISSKFFNARNFSIMESKISGMKGKALKIKYGISVTRIDQIVGAFYRQIRWDMYKPWCNPYVKQKFHEHLDIHKDEPHSLYFELYPFWKKSYLANLTASKPKPILDEDSFIEECDFSVRTYNALKRWNINNIRELKVYSDRLDEIKNIGIKSMNEINQVINKFRK